MQLFLTLLFASLATAVPHQQHQHRHALPAPVSVPLTTPNTSPITSRDADTTLSRMSDAQVDSICKTCWNGALQWPLPDTPNPVVDEPSPQLSIFQRPESTPNTLTVHNYCSYDIYFAHYAGASQLESGTLSAGSRIDRSLSGTVLKASKSSSMGQEVLIEYNSADSLWYDLSLITCLGTTNGLPNGDTSACAGHEAGLQLGNAGSKSFQCAAGAWCDDQAYLYQENLCKSQNPVWSCAASEGLVMEFCASQRS